MNPVPPNIREHLGGQQFIFAKDQKPYIALPASVDHEGTVMTEWEFTAEELATLLRGGRLRLWIKYALTRGRAMPPLKLEIIDAE